MTGVKKTDSFSFFSNEERFSCFTPGMLLPVTAVIMENPAETSLPDFEGWLYWQKNSILQSVQTAPYSHMLYNADHSEYLYSDNAAGNRNAFQKISPRYFADHDDKKKTSITMIRVSPDPTGKTEFPHICKQKRSVL